MKNIIILFLLLNSISTSFAKSDELSQKFALANSFYQKGEFEKAKEIYQEIANKGIRNKILYFNLANTYYRLNEIPNAILFYERAHLLDPFDEDINFNLQMANLRTIDKFEPIPKFFLNQWWGNLRNILNSEQWAIASVITIWLCAFAFALFLIFKTSKAKKITFLVGAILFLTFLSTSILAYSRYKYENSHTHAIIFATNSYIKSSPEETATDLFILHQGTKVEILDKISNWYKIRLPNGNIGWIKKDELEII